jgi:polysaccharide pyruvyl transferase WcaK-like protein
LNSLIENKKYVVSASSRFNYGDVLYAYIAENILEFDEHMNLSGTNVDPSIMKPTQAINKFRADRIVYLGGELFPKPYWSHWMLESKLKAYWYRLIQKVLKNKRYFLNSNSNNEYALAIGAQKLSSLDGALIERLQSFEFLGVRDYVTEEALTKLGVNCEFVPDLAFSIAEIFQPASVHDFKYGVFHFNEDTLTNNFDDCAALIKKISVKYNVKPVIQNFARCPNHDSESLSRKLALTSDAIFSEASNIKTITNVLAGADFYVGNSFHGGVVASSYGADIGWIGAHGEKLKNLALTYDLPLIDLTSTKSVELRKIKSNLSEQVIEKLKFLGLYRGPNNK